MSPLEKVNASLKRQLKTWVPNLIPGGITRGSEYVVKNPRRNDASVGSFSINLDTCAWSDFATGDSGGDPQSLYCYVHGLSNSEGAVRFLKEFGEAREARSEIAKRINKQAEINSNLEQVAPIPDGVELPELLEGHTHWLYQNTDGRVMFVVDRFVNASGEKTLRPWTYWVNESGEGEWRAKGLDKGLKPLLGIAHLRDKPVLIVEGEKTYDAARALFPDLDVVTWSNGASGVKKSDWTQLSGKQVLIWPDNDDTGFKAAEQIRTILGENAVIVPFERQYYPEKWDLADLSGDSSRELVVIKNALQNASSIPQVVQPGALQKFIDYAALGLTLNQKGGVVINLDNAVKLIENFHGIRDTIWFDEFYQRTFTKQGTEIREWSDVDDVALTVYIQKEIGIATMSEKIVSRAVALCAWRNRRNEPRDWLKTLKWDGIKRAEALFVDCFGAYDSEYVRSAGQNFMIAMVARLFEPGCKFDNMVVLEGKQGKFKSTALNELGGAWFMESVETMGTKDFLQGLHGKMLVEIAELDSFSKADTKAIKKTITCRVDRFRPSYGKYAQDFPRQCVFVGTTNEDEYLEDPTGGRRFWPIKTGVINIDLIRSTREQLFAEAVDLFKSGHSWWEMPDQAGEEQSSRRRHDVWEDTVARYLRGKDKVRLLEVATSHESLKIDIARFDKSLQMRLSGVMKTLGWHRVTARENGRLMKYWVLEPGPLFSEVVTEIEDDPFPIRRDESGRVIV